MEALASVVQACISGIFVIKTVKMELPTQRKPAQREFESLPRVRKPMLYKHE